jgi:sulfite reductase (ferredoxin)
VADIGFKGIVQKVRQADGSFADTEAFQVHLGGQLGAEAAFGRKFRGLKVIAAEAADYAERILIGYRQRRTEGESFAGYVNRAEEQWLL